MVEFEYASREQWRIAVVTIIVFLMVLILTMVHSVKLYSDLLSPEREVLNYRRSNTKPEITSRYKLISYLTYATIILSLLLLLVEGIEFNFSTGGCVNVNIILSLMDKFCWLSSRCITYLVFILWLHEIYGKAPKYAHDTKKLGCISITVILFYVTIFILLVIFTTSYTIFVNDADTLKYPYFCQVIFRKDLLKLILGIVCVWEIISCIIIILFFITPLNKLVADCQVIDKAEVGLKIHKMMYSGYKYKTLVIVNTTFTLLWILIAMSGMTALASVVGQLDFFINPLCLALMTYYYPNDRYYERLCCLCIAGCDPKRHKYKSTATYTLHKRNEDSVDTEMAFHAKLFDYHSNANANERDLLI